MLNKRKKKVSTYDIDQIDNSVLQISDLQDDKTAEKQPVQKKVPFAVVESYKTIRTNLMFLLDHSTGNNVITITSANVSEGKSTTSVNLAVAFSQLENKVLIIDADMRRSSVHKKLKLENDAGLSNILAGFVSFKDTVKKVNENFHVLTAGQIPPNPSELLGGKKFETLLEELKKEYAYILIDTPPVNVVSDALVIAPHTDGMLIVVRDRYTPTHTIKRAIENARFANVKILGAVMNGADLKANGRYTYRKYYYRKNYSRYGYGGYGYGYGYGSYGGYNSYGYGYGHRRNPYASAANRVDEAQNNNSK